MVRKTMMTESVRQDWTELKDLLSQPTPRNVRYAKVTQECRVAGVVLSLCVILIAYVGTICAVKPLDRLRRRGSLTNGVVINKYRANHRHTSDRLVYKFANGKYWYSDEITVSDLVYEKTAIGDGIPVTYLASDPYEHCTGAVSLSRVNNCLHDWLSGIEMGCGILVMAGVGFELVFYRQYRLLRYGTATEGTVIDKTETKITTRGWASLPKENTYFSVTYTYTVNGKPVTQSVSVTQDFYDSLQEGASVTILYNPENANENILAATILWATVYPAPNGICSTNA